MERGSSERELDAGGLRQLAAGAVDVRGAGAVAAQFSGSPGMSQNPFAYPDPRAAIEKASVWFTAYPSSMITKSGVLPGFARWDEELWRRFRGRGNQGGTHRPGQVGRRHFRLGRDPECRRTFRPDQHSD